ncbi:MAG: cytochrome c-type biogenesis protein CcmH [Proteobacteria bacterium]|nr:cytochrome c-type biogenesis protein CcmH [Pseudomonadota bacterium]
MKHRQRQHLPLATLALAIVLGLGSVAHAVDNTPPLADPVKQQRYLALTHELRCMQCQNEALADSNVSLAADLRLEVHDLIAQGKSDDQIRDYLVARYGEFILFRPRMSLRNAWLWGAPAILLLAGIVIAIRVIRRRSQLPIPDDEASDAGTDA